MYPSSEDFKFLISSLFIPGSILFLGVIQNFSLEHSLVKFLPTKLESDWKIYGIDLHYMYVLIKETKIFFSGDKKNKQILFQVLASSCM